jgi:hypothetical protein
LPSEEHVSEVFRFGTRDFEPKFMKVIAQHITQGARVFVGDGQLHRIFSSGGGDTAPSAVEDSAADFFRRAARPPLRPASRACSRDHS